MWWTWRLRLWTAITFTCLGRKASSANVLWPSSEAALIGCQKKNKPVLRCVHCGSWCQAPNPLTTYCLCSAITPPPWGKPSNTDTPTKPYWWYILPLLTTGCSFWNITPSICSWIWILLISPHPLNMSGSDLTLSLRGNKAVTGQRTCAEVPTLSFFYVTLRKFPNLCLPQIPQLKMGMMIPVSQSYEK